MARILGRSDLNFPNWDALEITDWRSEGADEAVAAAVEDARVFMEAGGLNLTSNYIGVYRDMKSSRPQWKSQIRVSSKTVDDFGVR